MSAIIIPRKHLRQPQGGRVAVDLANPLAQDIAAAFDLRAGPPLDVLTGLFSDSGGFNAATEQGLAFYRTSSPASTNDRRILHAGPVSIVAMCNPVVEAITSGIFSDRPTTGGAQHSFFANAAANGSAVSGRVSYGYLGTELTADGAVSGLMSVYGMSMVSAGGSVYVDGNAVTTTTSGTSGFQNPTAPRVLVGWHNSGYLRAKMPFLALWNRALSDDEHREIAANPWQLFRADPIRIYSFSTGAISINSILASNITQTGATITLGLTR